MDIGSLTGQISIEDQITDKLTEIVGHVKHFAEDFDGAFGAAAIGAGVVAAAIVGAAISVVDLGEKGSVILGVEENFNKLAVAAGTTGDALRGGLSEGVKGTVDEMTLMQSTSRLLSSGMKLTAADTLLMGEAARAMGKASGTDATQGLGTLSSALLTGRTRSLAMAGIVVDLKGAEDAYAKTLGVAATELSREGKLHADRIGILTATQAYVDRLGVSELTFKERLHQGRVAIEEWTAKLEKSVASSPNVMAALDSIQAALVKAFGGDSQSMLDTIVGWVNSFADAVAAYAPPIIQAVADIWHGIRDMWHEVRDAWDLVPDWFKFIARDSILAAGGVALVTSAVGGFDWTGWLGSLSNLAQVWSVWGATLVAFPAKAVGAIAAQYELAAASGTLAGSFTAILAPVALVTAAILGMGAILYDAKIAWDIWRTSTDTAAQAAQTLATNQKNLADINRRLNTNFTDYGDAIKYAQLHMKELNQGHQEFIGPQEDVNTRLKNAGDELKNGSAAATKYNAAVSAMVASWTDAGKSFKVTEGALGRLTAVQKADYEVQLTLIGVYEKLVAGHHKLTAAQEQEYLSFVKLHEEERARGIMALAGAGVTLRQIDAYKALGDSETAIAVKLHTTVDSLKEYTKNLEVMDKTIAVVALDTVNLGKLFPQQALEAGNAITREGLALGVLHESVRNLKDVDLSKVFDIARQGDKTGYNFGHPFMTAFEATLTAAPQAIVQAFTGGGGLLGAGKAIGSMLGSNIMSNIFGQEGDTKGKLLSNMTGVFGKVIGAAVPVIGALAGPLIGLIGRIIGGSEESNKVSPLRNEMFKMAGGLDALNPKVFALTGNLSLVDNVLKAKTVDQYNTAMAALDKLQQQVNADMQTAAGLYDSIAGKMSTLTTITPALGTAIQLALAAKTPADFAAALSGVNGVLDEQATKQATLQALADKYGFTLSEMGPQFAQGKLDTLSKAVIDDWTLLGTLGDISDSKLKKMSKSFQELVTDAMQTGGTLPESLRVPLERLAKMGELTDDAGNKMSDLGKLTFADTLDSALKGVKDALTDLRDVLVDLPSKFQLVASSAKTELDKIPRNIDVNVRSKVDTGGMPQSSDGFAGGGTVYAAVGALPFSPRGTDTVPAMLTPGETVRTKSQEALLRDRPDANAEIIASLAALRRDQNTKLPRAIARAVRDGLVDMRVA